MNLVQQNLEARKLHALAINQDVLAEGNLAMGRTALAHLNRFNAALYRKAAARIEARTHAVVVAKYPQFFPAAPAAAENEDEPELTEAEIWEAKGDHDFHCMNDLGAFETFSFAD